MKTIAVDDIFIAFDRQRKSFAADELHALTDSIQTKGLFHPIVLRDGKAGLTLVAGERRLRAVKDIWGIGGSFRFDGEAVPTDHIPYVTLGELTPLEAEEAECEENIQRANLTWQERAAAHARLAALRAAQASALGEAAPTVAAISEEVRGSSEGIHQELTRRELIVAKHLHLPEVAAAKTVDEAFKILRRSEATDKARALGESVGRTFTADLHRCINADALAWLVDCPAEQFDVILTDPIYGMGADEFGDSGGLAQGAHGYKDNHETWCKHMDILCPESFRITKAQAHLYVFCDIESFTEMKERFIAAGWWVFRTPLIWHKPSAMRAPWPENGPQRKYETCLYAVKGKRPVLKMAPDLVTYPPDTNLGHAAQKPVALFEDFLRRSVQPGDSVLDPFCGTGPIFPAAHALKCRATGIELDTASYGIAVKRIEGLKAQLDLGI